MLLGEGSPTPPPPEGQYVPDQIIVKFKETTLRSAEASLNETLGTEVVYTSPFAGFKVLQIPEGKTVSKMVEVYSEQSTVEYAEPNYVRRAIWSPNDTYYSYQWHFDQINLEDAWDLDTTTPLYGGDTSIVVAVVDTGVAYETYGEYVQAPDLANTNFTSGWDFVNDDAHPNDDQNHGTHVCGTIAQSTNNTIGVAGIAFNATIMPVKVIPGGIAEEADGIYFATDNGARIINMSIGGSGTSSTEENALAYAYSHGVTIICAAGNDYETGNDPEYPAAYDDYCIAVGATRYDQTHAYYSNTGSYLDIAAPGGDLTVDQNGDSYGDGVLQQTFAEGDPTDFGYYFLQGTSMACPHVAGVAALILAKSPSWTPDQVRQALESTATDLGDPGWDEVYGWGLLNAHAAVGLAPSTSPTVQTIRAKNITNNSATLVGNLTDLGSASSVTLSFVYGETPDCTDGETEVRVKTAPSYYGITLDGLSPDTPYYFKAKAVGDGTSYGEVKSFTTESVINTPPVVTNVTASQSSPIVNITYDVSDAEQSSVSISFEYWDGANWQPCINTTGEGTQSVGTGKSGTWDDKADFDEQYMPNCQIRVTADDGQGENNIGTGTSSDFALDTKNPTGYGCDTPGDGATDVLINPTLTCLTASDDSPPISYYFQLAENDTFSLGLQESGWQSSTTWSPSTISYDIQYFWRVKARDNYNNETAYSSTFDFITLSGGGVPPTVQTIRAKNITNNSATLVGNLTDLGSASSVTLSFVYGETPDCTDGETEVRVKTAPSYYGITLDGLSPDTPYYFKAKAVGDGTSYGEVKSFTTAGAGSVMSGDFKRVFFSTSRQLSGNPFPGDENIIMLLRFYLAFL